MLEHLPTSRPHDGVNRSLEHLLISKDNLRQQFQYFLIFCKVEGFVPKTIQNYTDIINPFIAFCRNELGIEDATCVTSHHVRSYLLTFKDRVKPYTFHDYFRAIKRFLNWLVDEGVLSVSPMSNMKTPPVPKVLIKPFHIEDLQSLLALCDKKTFLGIRNRAIILMLLETALRLEELANIQIEDINFNRGIIKVMGKGARERVVAIQPRTQKAILHYLINRNDTHRCLWVSEERAPLGLSGIYLMIHKLGKRAGLKNVRCSPHTFRHTGATMCLNNGAGEFEVQAMLGHSTLTMTRRYVASINSETAAEAHKRFSPVERLKL
ncbi:tyrosine-type recombinase/integrase [Chloroflexota bacterium]